VYSKHKATAADFLKFLTTAEQQKFFATQGSLAPVLTTLYDDSALVAQLPYLPVLKEAIKNAVPRPVTPFYPAVTKAIQTMPTPPSRVRSRWTPRCPTCRRRSSRRRQLVPRCVADPRWWGAHHRGSTRHDTESNDALAGRKRRDHGH